MFFSYFKKCLDYFLGVIFGFLAVLNFTQVITRYVLGISIPWLEEFSRYLIIWVSFIGAAIVTISDRHITIGTTLKGMFPRQGGLILDIAIKIFILIFLSIVIVLSFNYAVGSLDYGSSSLTWFKMGYIIGIIPFSCSIMLLWYVYAIYMDIKRLIMKFPQKEV